MMAASIEETGGFGNKKDRRRSVRNSWQHWFQAWIIKRIPPSRNVVLNHHNIFIFPTKQGLGFLLIIFLMFIGAVNYEVRLALALVFLLLSMLIISIFYTYRNLSGLEISTLPGPPVFAGEKFQINVVVNRHIKRMHESIQFNFVDSGSATANLINNSEFRLSLFVPGVHRGLISPGRLTIETIFPFGVFKAWSLINLNFDCLVYPTPSECDFDNLDHHLESDGINLLSSGNDDFYGLREYQLGDSLQHVSWKNLARGQGMFTKQYTNNVSKNIWLTWDMFKGKNTEERLSKISYCVIKLESNDQDYGLEIPGNKIFPGKGPIHYARVMKILALFEYSNTEQVSL